MNNAGELSSDMLIVLNDNKMSICRRVGSVARYLDRLRTNPFYTGIKTEVAKMPSVPLFGDPAERLLARSRRNESLTFGGMLFEELGIRYIDPIGDRNIGLMRSICG
ncbi:MAG: 1-deoxy-D-xylulose-5-phosphate synthase N-terminal domain-containing protein [Pirellulales bacterium]